MSSENSKIVNCILKTRGETLFTDPGGTTLVNLHGYAIVPKEDWLAAEAALRSAARTGPDVVGFEACREAAKSIANNPPKAPGRGHACITTGRSIAAAIAALPAPAGVEVTVEELARFLSPEPDRCVFGSGGISTDANGKTTSSFSCSRYAWEDQIALAGRLKSRFTILAKPAQEGQGS